MTLDEARATAKRLPKISTVELDAAIDTLHELCATEEDDVLIDNLYDERERREDIEPHDDTPSLDLPTYGA